MRFTGPSRDRDGRESNGGSTAPGTNDRIRASASSKRPRSGAGRSRGGDVSSDKKFVSMSLLTFIVIIVLGAVWGHHAPADTTGPAFTSLSNYPKVTTNVPQSQAGFQALA